MHCFGGTLEQAQRYVAAGFLVSLACVVTYPKNEEARRIARELPLDSLVIETDSPYLPPQEFRGRRNEPAYVVAAAKAIAEARGIAFDEVAAATTANAERLFGVRVREKVRT
jgi:TatD DNase family protein